MFERFTDRARKTLVLAQDEARSMGHNFIGTEHILLGLMREGEGVAGVVLKSYGANIDMLRTGVEALVPASAPAITMSLPFTHRVKKLLELSLRESLQLGHNYIGTEHILLALIREGEGVGAQVLVRLGLELAVVRQKVVNLLSGYETAVVSVEVPAHTARSFVQWVKQFEAVVGPFDDGHPLVEIRDILRTAP